jgi:dTDP-4-dehydrorhamnose 3,5-epimerase
MHGKSTNINNVYIIEPQVFGDNRGYFFESFHADKFREIVGGNPLFVQDNESKSAKNVLRGLHFQNPPFDQGKLVRVSQGQVLDVVVDIRVKSSTYGEVLTVILDDVNHNMLWVPPGMAHGFVSLQDDTIFNYKCTNFYNPNEEGCIKWNDPSLKIDWQCIAPTISEKDKKGVTFSEFKSPFIV